MIELLIRQINKDRDGVLKFITDSSLLKKGIYLKIDIDKPVKDNIEQYIIVNKAKTSEDYVCNLELEKRKELIDYISTRDALSKFLNDDANKAIDTPKKKVLSTVYLTVAFTNKFSPLNENSKEKSKFKNTAEMMSHFSNNMYGKYRNFGKFDEKRDEQISICENYLRDNIGNILLFVNKLGVTNDSLVKIFFTSSSGVIDDNITNYEKEYTRYLSLYLFNGKSMEMINGEERGSIPYGFNNNTGKKFIKPRRMNISSVKLHSLQEALDTKLAYELLKIINDNNSSAPFGFNNICSSNLAEINFKELSEMDTGGKSLFYKLNFKEKYIEKYDLVAEYTKIDDLFINATVEFREFIENTEPLVLKHNTNTLYINELLAVLISTNAKNLNNLSDYVFTAGFFRDKGAVMYENMAGIVFKKYKYLLNEFLREKQIEKEKEINEELINKIVNDFTWECVKIYFDTMYSSDSFRYNLVRLLNIRLNILNRFRKGHEILKLVEDVSEKLLNYRNVGEGLYPVESDNEYYYLMGQTAYYIEKRSKGDVDFSIFKFYSEKKDVAQLKAYLLSRFNIYSYAIDTNFTFFKNMLATLLNYTPATGINKNLEAFYLGLCANNIFYVKKEKKNTEGEAVNE